LFLELFGRNSLPDGTNVTDTPDGVRGFAVADPDGNELFFYSEQRLFAAARAGDARAVAALLKQGANPNARRIRRSFDDAETINATPVIVSAAFDGFQQVVRVLAQHGADINSTDSNGLCALCAACMCGKFRTVRVLLQSGADPNRRD